MIGGAVVNGGFLLVSLGHGIKRATAVTRAGARFTVREPVRDLVKQGRERMEQALSTDTFEHEGQRVQLTGEERRYLEHEIAAHESKKPPEATKSADGAAKPAEGSHERGDAEPIEPSAPPGETHPAGDHPTENPTTERPGAPPSVTIGGRGTHADITGQIEAALSTKVKPEDVKALSAALGDEGMLAVSNGTGERLPDLVADAGSAAVSASAEKFGAQATAKLLKGLGGSSLRKLVNDAEKIALQLDADGSHGSYRWGGTSKTVGALT